MQSELFDVKGLGDYLDISVRSCARHNDAGVIPRPVRIGSSVRWVRATIDQWIAAGAPDCRKTGWTPPTTAAGEKCKGRT